jgi:hypothetical protein
MIGQDSGLNEDGGGVNLWRLFIDTSKLLVFIARILAAGGAAAVVTSRGLLGAAFGMYSSWETDEN